MDCSRYPGLDTNEGVKRNRHREIAGGGRHHPVINETLHRVLLEAPSVRDRVSAAKALIAAQGQNTAAAISAAKLLGEGAQGKNTINVEKQVNIYIPSNERDSNPPPIIEADVPKKEAVEPPR